LKYQNIIYDKKTNKVKFDTSNFPEITNDTDLLEYVKKNKEYISVLKNSRFKLNIARDNLTKIQEIDFSNSIIEIDTIEVQFIKCNFYNTSLINGMLLTTKFEDCNLEKLSNKEIKSQNKELNYMIYREVTFEKCNMMYSNFENSFFEDFLIKDCNLFNMNLRNLKRVNYNENEIFSNHGMGSGDIVFSELNNLSGKELENEKIKILEDIYFEDEKIKEVNNEQDYKKLIYKNVNVVNEIEKKEIDEYIRTLYSRKRKIDDKTLDISYLLFKKYENKELYTFAKKLTNKKEDEIEIEKDETEKKNNIFKDILNSKSKGELTKNIINFRTNEIENQYIDIKLSIEDKKIIIKEIVKIIKDNDIVVGDFIYIFIKDIVLNKDYENIENINLQFLEDINELLIKININIFKLIKEYKNIRSLENLFKENDKLKTKNVDLFISYINSVNYEKKEEIIKNNKKLIVQNEKDEKIKKLLLEYDISKYLSLYNISTLDYRKNKENIINNIRNKKIEINTFLKKINKKIKDEFIDDIMTSESDILLKVELLKTNIVEEKKKIEIGMILYLENKISIVDIDNILVKVSMEEKIKLLDIVSDNKIKSFVENVILKYIKEKDIKSRNKYNRLLLNKIEDNIDFIFERENLLNYLIINQEIKKWVFEKLLNKYKSKETLLEQLKDENCKITEEMIDKYMKKYKVEITKKYLKEKPEKEYKNNNNNFEKTN